LLRHTISHVEVSGVPPFSISATAFGVNVGHLLSRASRLAPNCPISITPVNSCRHQHQISPAFIIIGFRHRSSIALSLHFPCATR
jgi:hypothetical protein